MDYVLIVSLFLIVNIFDFVTFIQTMTCNLVWYYIIEFKANFSARDSDFKLYLTNNYQNGSGYYCKQILIGFRCSVFENKHKKVFSNISPRYFEDSLSFFRKTININHVLTVSGSEMYGIVC